MKFSSVTFKITETSIISILACNLIYFNSSSSNLFVSKNTKDTRANYSSEYIVILSTNFASYSVSLKGDCEVTG